MMDSPWEILGLDPESASSRDVKRAYARLLKQHRPDKDPEKFQEVREAYEWAASELKWKAQAAQWETEETEAGRGSESEGSDVACETEEFEVQPGDADEGLFPKLKESKSDEGAAEEDVSVGPDFSARAVDLTSYRVSEDLKPVIEKIEAATRDLDWSNDEALVEVDALYEEGIAHCRENPGDIEGWSKAIFVIFTGHEEFLKGRFGFDEVVRELENDCAGQSHLLLSYLEASADIEYISGLSDHLRIQQKRLVTPAAAVFMSRLAAVVGFVQPAKATSLLDIAYPHLPLQERHYVVNRAEQMISIGQVFGNAVSSSRLHFWWKRFSEAERGVEFDWYSPEGVEEVGHLTSSVLVNQPMMNCIAEVMPEEVLTRVKGSMQRNQRENVSRQNYSQQSDSGSSSGNSKSMGCWIVFVIYVIIKVIIAISSSSFSDSSYDSDYDPIGNIEELREIHENSTFKVDNFRRADGSVDTEALAKYFQNLQKQNKRENGIRFGAEDNPTEFVPPPKLDLGPAPVIRENQ